MSTQMEVTRHELLRDIEDNVSALCKNYNLDQDICEQISIHVADFLAEHYGGMVISFPKDFHYKIAQRDLDIYNDFNGNNWLYLIRKYNMTESGIRKVINRVSRRIIKRNQFPTSPLFISLRPYYLYHYGSTRYENVARYLNKFGIV